MQKLPIFAAGGIKPSHNLNLPVSLHPTCSPACSASVDPRCSRIHSRTSPSHPSWFAEASGVRCTGGNSLSFRARDFLSHSLSLVTFVKHHASPLHISILSLSLSTRSFFGVFRVQQHVFFRVLPRGLSRPLTHSRCVRPFSTFSQPAVNLGCPLVHRSQYFWIAPIHR